MDKLCARCGTDVSDKPRVKDPQGRYFCADCVKALKARQAEKKAAAAPPASSGDVMDDLVEGAVATLGEPCEVCQSPMPADAVICTRCGHNRQTGRNTKTRVQEVKQPGKGAAAAKLAGAAAGASFDAMTPVFAVAGGLIGGAVGAAIWAAIAYYAEVEIGWIAWGVGILVGAGVAVGARGNISWLTGGIAAVIALVSVFGGRYAVFKIWTEEQLGSTQQVIAYTEQDALQELIDEMAQERIDNGETVAFKNGTTIEDAYYPDDYPDDLVTAVQQRWDSWSPDERRAYTASKEAQTRRQFANAKADIAEAGFLDEFGPIDVLFAALAVFSAFGVGATGFDYFEGD